MTSRARYILDHAPTMLLIQAQRAAPGAKLDLEAAIRLAGALWDKLAASEAVAPNPAARPSEPRKTADHYGSLSPAQRDGFDRFYRAYGHPKGKQRAAARWAEIAPDEPLAKRIAAAAEADRAQPRAPDAVRKYPEGWLSERRWEDAPLPGDAPEAHADPQALRAEQIRELVNERAGLRRLASAGDPHITALLADIERRLAAHGLPPEAQAPAPARAASGPRPLTDFLRGPAA